MLKMQVRHTCKAFIFMLHMQKNPMSTQTCNKHATKHLQHMQTNHAYNIIQSKAKLENSHATVVKIKTAKLPCNCVFVKFFLSIKL